MGEAIKFGRGLLQVPVLAADLEVGTSVYLNENGSPVEYLVVNQGIPSGSSLYDSSCDGTWLLRKDIYETRAWDATNNDYANSDIHSYLNGTFRLMYDVEFAVAIRTVNIPYNRGTGSGGSIASGSSGLYTQIFLLSIREIGIYTNAQGTALQRVEGARLSYFADCPTGDESSNERTAYLNGTATAWWLRSPDYLNTGWVLCAGADGSLYSGGANWNTTDNYGVRPALIISPNAKFDSETLEFKGV